MTLQRAWNARTYGFDGSIEEREVVTDSLTPLCCGGYRARLVREGQVIAMKDVASAHEGAQWLHQFSEVAR